jgi:hypothetical protein
MTKLQLDPSIVEDVIAGDLDVLNLAPSAIRAVMSVLAWLDGKSRFAVTIRRGSPARPRAAPARRHRSPSIESNPSLHLSFRGSDVDDGVSD